VANVGPRVKMFSSILKKRKRKEKTFTPRKKLLIHVHLHSWKESNNEKIYLIIPLEGL